MLGGAGRAWGQPAARGAITHPCLFSVVSSCRMVTQRLKRPLAFSSLRAMVWKQAGPYDTPSVVCLRLSVCVCVCVCARLRGIEHKGETVTAVGIGAQTTTATAAAGRNTMMGRTQSHTHRKQQQHQDNNDNRGGWAGELPPISHAFCCWPPPARFAETPNSY